MNMSTKNNNKRLLWILSFAACLMFGFGFALVPLYNVLCKVTGLNGKTNAQAVNYSANQIKVDPSRTIKIEFTATNNENLPWEFRPVKNSISVHPGEKIRTAYFAANRSDHTMTVQAIPSITPGGAAKYFKKIECFCFTSQTFDSNQQREMPVLFYVDNNLPKDIQTITLSYTLFDQAHLKRKG